MDVKLWESSDLVSPTNCWICLKGVPLPYWHDKFFPFIGAKFGRFIKVSPATLNGVNLSEAWVRFDVASQSKHSLEIVAKFREGSGLITAEIFSSYEVPIRVFTGFNPSASSNGSCCRALSDKEWDVHDLDVSSHAVSSVAFENDRMLACEDVTEQGRSSPARSRAFRQESPRIEKHNSFSLPEEMPNLGGSVIKLSLLR